MVFYCWPRIPGTTLPIPACAECGNVVCAPYTGSYCYQCLTDAYAADLPEITPPEPEPGGDADFDESEAAYYDGLNWAFTRWCERGGM